MDLPEIVITGLGIVSPIGIGREAFWDALTRGRSGVGPICSFDPTGLPVRIAAEVLDFDPKAYVRPRKSLKVMARDAQLGVAASVLAMEEAGLERGAFDPDRLGVVLGADAIDYALHESLSTYEGCMAGGRFEFSRWGEAMWRSFPLGFLKVLPNMIASHVSIAHDARGPNNTMHHGELSSLLAVIEAARVIQRGSADMMLAGGASSAIQPIAFVRRAAKGGFSQRQDDPAAAIRPFDADRDGQVHGEGAAMFVLESRSHAESRGAPMLGRLLSWAVTAGKKPANEGPPVNALRRVIKKTLEDAAGSTGLQVGHVSAHGLSTIEDDRSEARAIHAMLPDVPVTALKSYMGNLGAAGGAMEMAADLLALGAGKVPPTLNYGRPDPECPVRVIHTEPLEGAPPTALKLSFSAVGQAASVLLGAGE
jgi:3-oxoacyl-[acyl-carrier-protein] synthase II